jgi:hypothetical protein
MIKYSIAELPNVSEREVSTHSGPLGGTLDSGMVFFIDFHQYVMHISVGENLAKWSLQEL